MKSWYTIRARGPGAEGSRAEVLIYDEIGAYGVSAKGFLAELGALPDGVPIDLRLNSPGGSVFDAVAIYNALQRHAGEITVWIDGIAASAASYIAMAGDEIVMPENAFMMIHDPSGLVMGTAADVREMADTMDKIAGSMVRGYAGRSGRSEEEIAALMAAETWFDAAAALAAGLATRMIAPVRIAARFDIARLRNAPPILAEAVTQTVGAANGSDTDVMAADADAPGRDEGGARPDPESPAGGESFDPAPAGDPGFKVADGNLEQVAEETPPSPRDARDVGNHNIPSGNARPPNDQAAGVPDGNTDPIPSGSGGPVAEANPAPEAAAIRAAVIANARAVIDLCRLAGQPQMAGRFLEEDASLDDVRTRLLAARAEATPDITSSAHAQPGRAAPTQSWGEVIARTFKMKG